MIDLGKGGRRKISFLRNLRLLLERKKGMKSDWDFQYAAHAVLSFLPMTVFERKSMAKKNFN
jgi:hypothetical protein